MLTTKELDRLQAVDIGAIDPADLPQADESQLDTRLTHQERVFRLLRGDFNPYCFSVGGVGVKVEFADQGPALQVLFEGYLMRQKAGG